jgi:hypothetical protein
MTFCTFALSLPVPVSLFCPCVLSLLSLLSILNPNIPVPKNSQTRSTSMSQWAQQIREAKGPALNLSSKGITATDCVEIAQALQVKQENTPVSAVHLVSLCSHRLPTAGSSLQLSRLLSRVGSAVWCAVWSPLLGLSPRCLLWRFGPCYTSSLNVAICVVLSPCLSFVSTDTDLTFSTRYHSVWLVICSFFSTRLLFSFFLWPR